jgi:hypothetical protein
MFWRTLPRLATDLSERLQHTHGGTVNRFEGRRCRFDSPRRSAEKEHTTSDGHMRKALIFTAASLLLSGCTDADPHRECTQHADCADGQVCQFDVCVDEGSTQDKVCRTGFAYCGDECVDTQASLATCGGCDGCPAVEHAEAISCSQGVCQYTCTDDYRDRDDNPANGCDCPPGTDCSCIVEGPELCDLRDNDCDGVVDNVQLTDPTAEWRAHCPELPHAQPNTCQAGFCTYACDEGFADRNDPTDGCECEITPEVCDGADNDCNGIIDDGEQTALCPPVAGASPTCFGTECVYNCAPDHADIDGDLTEGAGGNGCECQRSGPEICDGEDNDCDGLTDEQDDDLTTSPCENQNGVCGGAHRECAEGVEQPCTTDTFTAWAQSQGEIFEAHEASCDETDNDCDGTDDDFCCLRGSFGFPVWENERPSESPNTTGIAISGDNLLHIADSASGSWATLLNLDFERLRSPVRLGEPGRVFALATPSGFLAGILDESGLEIHSLTADGDLARSDRTTLPFEPHHNSRSRVHAITIDEHLLVALGSGGGTHLLAIRTDTVVIEDEIILAGESAFPTGFVEFETDAYVSHQSGPEGLAHGVTRIRFSDGRLSRVSTSSVLDLEPNNSRQCPSPLCPTSGLVRYEQGLVYVRPLRDAHSPFLYHAALWLDGDLALTDDPLQFGNGGKIQASASDGLGRLFVARGLTVDLLNRRRGAETVFNWVHSFWGGSDGQMLIDGNLVIAASAGKPLDVERPRPQFWVGNLAGESLCVE